MTTSEPKADAKDTASPRPSVRPGGAESLIGTTISGRYKIEKLLGEGGMGAVYQAEHTHMRKRLAVKVLHPEMSRLPEVVARFEREAMAAAHIDHPNVAAATDFGKLEDGSFFLVLEYVEGKSLRELIQKGRLDTGRALRILRQIAAALQRAHVMGIVHRDLKPENVMLIDRDGEQDFVKVLDFGIAKVPVADIGREPSARGEPGQALTQLGMVYGTPEYMAPEQALGQNVDPRADIYALGCMTFEMLAGVRPFDHESKVTLLGMHVTAPIPTVASKCPDAVVPPEIEAILHRMLEKEASARYADAKDLMDAIDAVWNVGWGAIPGAPASQVAGPRASLVGGASSQSYSGNLPALPGTRPGLNTLVGRARALVSANPKPFMIGFAAFASLVGFVLILLLVSGVTHKGGSVDAGVATVSPSSTTQVKGPDDVETQIAKAIESVDKGDFGTGITKLTQIEGEHGDRPDVHRALERAYTATKNTPDAMREAELWLKADPDATKDLKLLEDVRNAALGRDAGDAAFTMLEGEMGTVGPDILYDIAHGQSGVGYPQAAQRATKSLAKPSVRGLASATLLVTIDLRAARDCDGKKKLLDKAKEVGDARTLTVLKSYASTRGCGFLSTRDCWPCMHKDGSLAKTIAVLEDRASSHAP